MHCTHDTGRSHQRADGRRWRREVDEMRVDEAAGVRRHEKLVALSGDTTRTQHNRRRLQLARGSCLKQQAIARAVGQPALAVQLSGARAKNAVRRQQQQQIRAATVVGNSSLKKME